MDALQEHGAALDARAASTPVRGPVSRLPRACRCSTPLLAIHAKRLAAQVKRRTQRRGSLRRSCDHAVRQNNRASEMADILQFPHPPKPANGDGDGPTEIVVRVVFEMPEGPSDETDDEPDPEPPEKTKGGWGWFWLGALLGLGLGG